MRARIIRIDGSTEAVDIPEGSRGQLDFMYKTLDCTAVDVIRLVENGPGRPGLDMWIDDDGLFTKKPNAVATLVTTAITGREMVQYVVGDVLITGGADSEGDTLGLTEMQESVLSEFIPAIAIGIIIAVA